MYITGGALRTITGRRVELEADTAVALGGHDAVMLHNMCGTLNVACLAAAAVSSLTQFDRHV
jgi:hypothetical protein